MICSLLKFLSFIILFYQSHAQERHVLEASFIPLWVKRTARKIRHEATYVPSEARLKLHQGLQVSVEEASS